MVATMDGRMRGGGSGVSTWLVTVIIILAVLQLHVTVGVAAGRQMPRQLLHESCLKVSIVAIICFKGCNAGRSLVCVVVVILCFNQILVSLGAGFSEYSEVASKLDAFHSSS
jgi:multisubunit Na+/H+ antiporter MnhF subunit